MISLVLAPLRSHDGFLEWEQVGDVLSEYLYFISDTLLAGSSLPILLSGMHICLIVRAIFIAFMRVCTLLTAMLYEAFKSRLRDSGRSQLRLLLDGESILVKAFTATSIMKLLLIREGEVAIVLLSQVLW